MRYAWVAAAVAGAATMALEVLTARRLAPAFGLTLSTWAVLIAATLLAGAVGALVGARFGGRPSRSGIATALAIAAVLGLRGVYRPFERWIRPSIVKTPYRLLSAAFYSPLCLFLAALIVARA